LIKQRMQIRQVDVGGLVPAFEKIV